MAIAFAGCATTPRRDWASYPTADETWSDAARVRRLIRCAASDVASGVIADRLDAVPIRVVADHPFHGNNGLDGAIYLRPSPLARNSAWRHEAAHKLLELLGRDPMPAHLPKPKWDAWWAEFMGAYRACAEAEKRAAAAYDVPGGVE